MLVCTVDIYTYAACSSVCILLLLFLYQHILMPRNQWSTSSFQAVDLNFPFYESFFVTMFIWVLGECIYLAI